MCLGQHKQSEKDERDIAAILLVTSQEKKTFRVTVDSSGFSGVIGAKQYVNQSFIKGNT